MSEYVFPFEKLQVWRLSVDLAEFVLDLLDNFPKNRHIRLVGQMESAVTSPAQNTAEGKGRQYKKEFIQFLYIATGSLYEVLSLTELFHRRYIFSDEDAINIRGQAETVSRKVNGLIKTIKSR